MKKNNLILVIIFFFIFGEIFSGILPANRNYEWSKAGLIENLNYADTINVLSYGFDNTGLISNNQLMKKLLDSINQTTVLFFPKGTYFFDGTVKLKSNISVVGENPDFTKFIFNCSGKGDVINISGKSTNNESIVVEDIGKFTSYCIVKEANFSSGDFVYLYEDDTDKITSDWAKYSTGQILEILKVINDTLFFSTAIRREYSLNKNPKVKLIEPIKNVRISKISIQRLDSTASQTANIKFSYAFNCSVVCIQSKYCNYSHIDVRFSKNISVTGSYFNDAFSFGGGGRAYGVMLHFGTSDCLVYNNIFDRLRHSMIVQAGANGNVFAYNYSLNPFWTEVVLPSDAAGDMVCHGNYPYANLFEGNICQNIVIDDSHGKNGPHNTFFRNRAENYGIFMNNNPASDEQTFIGNEIVSDEPFHGLYLLFGEDHFEYGNNVKGEIFPKETTELNDKSLFLNDILEWYLSNEHFPPIGIPNELLQYNNEAYVRFYNSQLVSCDSYNTEVYDNISDAGIFYVFPNPANDVINIDFLKDKKIKDLIIFNNLGQKMEIGLLENDNNLVRLDISSLPTGSYQLIVFTERTIYCFKFFKL